MARRRSPIKYLLNHLLVIILKVVGVLPLPVARWIARRVAHAAFHVVPRVKSVGLANLDLAYGDELTAERKRQILRESLENMVLTAVEFPSLPKLHGEFLRRHARLTGEEHLASKQGVILIGAHFGNWEWMSAVLAGHGYRGAGIMRPLDHAALNKYVDRMRRAGGVLTIPKDDAAQAVLPLLKKGNMKVGVLMDQSPRENAVPTRFFGQPCWTTIAPVLFAIRARAPVFPVAMTRLPDDTYRLEVFPELELIRTGKIVDDLVENTQRWQDAIEAIVRQNPGHWLWLHRRWRTRPRLEKEWAERINRTT